MQSESKEIKVVKLIWNVCGFIGAFWVAYLFWAMVILDDF